MSSFVSPAQSDITHLSVRLFTENRSAPQVVAFFDGATVHLDLAHAQELREKLTAALAEAGAA